MGWGTKKVMSDIFSSIKMTKFIRDISKAEKIAVYGAGVYAQNLLKILKKKNIKVAFLVVTNKNEDSLENIPIHTLEECVLRLQREDIITIIAVDKTKEREIQKNLDRCKIENYLRINDYFRKYAVVAQYQNSTKKDYLDSIVDWHADIFGLQEKILIDKLKGDIEVPKDPKRIAFVVEMVEPRILKLQKALVSNGFRVTTILKKNAYGYNGVSDELRKNSIETFEFQCVEEAMFYVLRSKSYIVHIFTAWDNCSLAYIFINQKEIFSKVVVERYDVMNGMYYRLWNCVDEEFERILMLERFCLEHADGVCFRSFALDFLKDKLNFKFLGKTLRFLDYYEENNDLFQEISDNLTDEEELTLCYAGGIVTERDNPNFPAACFLELGKKCEANKCHLHIYPVYWHEEKWKDYIELDRKSRYFHFHHPIEYVKLCQVISKYDFGIHPIRKNIFEKEKTGNLTYNAPLYASVNKFFDYISAGLPIIAAEPVELVKEFEAKEMLIRWTLEEYDYDELRQRKRKMKESVKKNRDSFMMKNQIKRLIDFYAEL